MPRTPTQAWRHHGDAHLSILFDVFALGQRVRTLVATAMRGAGLRPDEYAAYSVVFEDGPVTMTALARTLGMPLTTAADYVRTMVERGDAHREAHPSDQRATVLTLTAEGLRTHRRASRAFDRAYQALARELTVDEAAARDMLQALADSVARAGAALSVPARGSPEGGSRTNMHD